MTSTQRPRVVVGIDGTVAGLRALRSAVAEARRRGAVLHAVRAWTFGTNGQGAWPGWIEDQRRLSVELIAKVFADTMGGLPVDVDLVAVSALGPPGPVLTDYAHRDDDLLVVGTHRGTWLTRPLRHSVPRYCVAHANCPVLVVPLDAFTRQAVSEGMGRAIRRELPELIG